MDSRARNSMDEPMRIVHARLEQWAKWSKENPGTLPTTPLGRFGDEGDAIFCRATGSPAPVVIPLVIEQTDLAVARLGDIDHKVIKVYYYHWEPVSVLCKRVRMQESKFKAAVRRARWHVSLHLNTIMEVYGAMDKNCPTKTP